MCIDPILKDDIHENLQYGTRSAFENKVSVYLLYRIVEIYYNCLL